MRAIITLCLFCLNINNIVSQISFDAVLNQKLEGKTKFHDIKSTVWTHLTDKLKGLDSKDSIGRKLIKRQMKMWNRQFWINEYYTNGNGEVDPQSKVIINALTKRDRDKPKEAKRGQEEGWVSNGPISTNFDLFYGEGVGRINRIAFHPTEDNVIFAGSAFGGLFKTTDSGANWYPISAYVASLGVAGIAINPNNPNIIYVLSGDGNKSGGGCFNGAACFNDDTSLSNGVYKTINGGETWTKLPDFPVLGDSIPYYGRNIIINPSDPRILYAATNMGLYKSIDSGNNWTQQIASINIWDVAFKPNNPDTLYCVSNNGFYKTNSAGDFILKNVPDLNQSERISIAVTTANPDKVVLFAGNDSQNSCIGVFISQNSGNTFVKRGATSQGQDNLFHNFIDLNVTLPQQDFNNTVAISPTNENLIFVGGLCVWSSEDNGVNWSQETAYWATSDVLHEYIHADQHHLIYHPNGKLYAANDGGVYVSEDDGDDWDFIETGLSTTQFYHFEWENDDGDPWGGAQDNGVLKRNDIYEFTLHAGGDGYDVMTDHPWRASDGTGSQTYYTNNESIGADGTTGISVPDNTDFFGNLAMKPDEANYIYVGYQKSTYYSVTQGLIWAPLPDSIPGNNCIAAGTNHNLRLYTSGYNAKNGNKRLFRRDANDITDLTGALNINGSLINLGYNIGLKITDIEVNNVNDDVVYISIGGVVDTVKVFASTDAGLTWTNITYNLPNVPVFCLELDEMNGLYAGTSIGVYYKKQNNPYWEPYYNSLPPVPVTQIEVEGNFVHCSTFGRGLWTTLKYTTDCPENRTMTGAASGRNYWEASNIITSTQTIESPGADVIYNGGNKVILSPGLYAKKGTSLKVSATGCGGETPLLKTPLKAQKEIPTKNNIPDKKN